MSMSNFRIRILPILPENPSKQEPSVSRLLAQNLGFWTPSTLDYSFSMWYLSMENSDERIWKSVLLKNSYSMARFLLSIDDTTNNLVESDRANEN